MIQEVFREELAVRESLVIKKNRIGEGPKRICIVTGTHGDELEGQYVAWKLQQVLKAQPDCLKGIVDIYPATNPLGISTMTRSFPLTDMDMNRGFPGKTGGPLNEHLSGCLMDDLAGADMVIDIHASNIYLREIPQVRINVNVSEELLSYAKKLNMDFIWIHAAATVLEATLAHSLNSIGTKTLVVEMGIGMRITEEYGNRLVEGILNLMKYMGMWEGESKDLTSPIVSSDGAVSFMNANASGLFFARASHSQHVSCGEELGIIADPLTGEIKEHVISPVDGLLFTIREYPIVYPGSLIARILGEVK